uniref:Uncharacterized protein n=1 Tax=Chlamydomonas euryale TaxID=1486919 RepID=A0A7R9VI75_9CHLO|eukprot:12226-Chlamydomonas_euryale.AAC.1
MVNATLAALRFKSMRRGRRGSGDACGADGVGREDAELEAAAMPRTPGSVEGGRSVTWRAAAAVTPPGARHGSLPTAEDAVDVELSMPPLPSRQ